MALENKAPQNMNSSPIHPATVHFPIAFISLACGLDMLFAAATSKTTSSLVTSVYDVTPFIGDISRAAHLSNILGILTAIPAVLSGAPQLLGMINKLGFQVTIKDKNGKVVARQMNSKVKVGIAHAIMNDIAIALSVYNWWTRRNKTAFVPDSTNILLSTVVLPGLLFAAYLGGSMVYKFGVGVTNQSNVAKTKGH